MNLQRFKALSQKAQEEVVKHYGVFLSERRSLDLNVLLYQIDGFYAEVFYLRESSEIVWIKSFEDTALLEPYLLDIDVHPLLA